MSQRTLSILIDLYDMGCVCAIHASCVTIETRGAVHLQTNELVSATSLVFWLHSPVCMYVTSIGGLHLFLLMHRSLVVCAVQNTGSQCVFDAVESCAVNKVRRRLIQIAIFCARPWIGVIARQRPLYTCSQNKSTPTHECPTMDGMLISTKSTLL